MFFIYSPVPAWAWLFSHLRESHARELWQQNKFILIPTYENSHTNLYSTTNLHSRIPLVTQSHFIILEPSIDWTEAPSICPDCAWPHQNFQKFVWTSVYSLFLVKICLDWQDLAQNCHRRAGDLRNAWIWSSGIEITLKTNSYDRWATFSELPIIRCENA